MTQAAPDVLGRARWRNGQRASQLLSLALLALACTKKPTAPPHRHETPDKAPVELSPAKVLQALRGGESERRACFEASGQESGNVRLTWRTDTRGNVQEANVTSSTLDDQTAESCLVEHISRIRFDVEDASMGSWSFVHRLPYAPGVREFLQRKRAEDAKRKRHRKRESEEEPSEEEGLEVDESSPGWLEPTAVADVVRSGFGLFAHCYRDGLAKNPTLAGVLRLRIVIDEDGSVAGVLDGGSELPDAEMLDCVAEGIFALRFPEPDRSGDVRVLYRLVFDSG